MNRGSLELAKIFEAAPRGFQRRMAKKTGISQSWLSRIAAGAKPDRKVSLLIEQETGISPSSYDEPAEALAPKLAG